MGALKTYFGGIKNSVLSTFEGMAVTASWVFREPSTIQYPYHKRDKKTVLGGPDSLPERYRGFLEVDMEICTACLACERACPISCIKIDVEKFKDPNDPDAKPVRKMTRFDIDMAKCMYCGLCSEPCPTESIRHTREFEAPVANLEHLLMRFVQAGEPVTPFKVKKGEEPDPGPFGGIARKLYVERAWDLPPIDFPEPEPEPEPEPKAESAAAPKAD